MYLTSLYNENSRFTILVIKVVVGLHLNYFITENCCGICIRLYAVCVCVCVCVCVSVYVCACESVRLFICVCVSVILVRMLYINMFSMVFLMLIYIELFPSCVYTSRYVASLHLFRPPHNIPRRSLL